MCNNLKDGKTHFNEELERSVDGKQGKFYCDMEHPFFLV